MVIYFFYIICSLLSLYGIIKIISFFWVMHHLKRQKKDIHPEKLTNKKLVFILPVYHETAMIQDTISSFKRLLSENILLLIVGTNRERNHDNINSTLQLAEECGGWNPHIFTIECPNKTGYMAHQVNYAAQRLVSNGYDKTSTRIHVINIDTRLQEDYLSEVIFRIHKNSTIMLQSALFTWNFTSLSPLLQWTSIVQSRRTITGEQRRLLLNLYISHYKLYHVVGHGMIIQLKKFFDYKLFPEDTLNEDMHFWYYLSINQEKVIPLISYEIADMPSTFKGWWAQAQWRFIGAMEYHAYFCSYLKKFNQKPTLRILLMTLQWFFNAFKRLIVSYTIVFVIVIMALFTLSNIFIIWIISICIYLMHYWLTIIYLRNNGYIPSAHIKYLFYSFLIVCIRSVPATLSLCKYILHRFWLYHYIKYKSDHA